MGDIIVRRKLHDIIAEYEQKRSEIPKALEEFKKAGDTLKTSSCIQDVHGQTHIDTGNVYESTLEQSLLKSAWQYVYNQAKIEHIATAKDKELFSRSMANPPEFTLENIASAFGHYLQDPWGNILKGLAEVFCSLDQAYKSHEKVKIGVKGLPKRIILSGFGGFSTYGENRLKDVLNAIALYQGKPLVTYSEIRLIMKNGEALRETINIPKDEYQEEIFIPGGRGVWLKKYKNGNAHLYFDDITLNDINKALSEYYGDVLPDCSQPKPNKTSERKDVAKDLQYYPTPKKVVDEILSDIYGMEGKLVLEPSCGCGRFMDAIKSKGAKVTGIEVDAGRVKECRDKGHSVIHGNFLEMTPKEEFDFVIMNPPFYGTHYAKHVKHAYKFLKPGGRLVSILPSTARYDHGLLEQDGRFWRDLPVGSFRESGTNINTSIYTIRKPDND